MKSQTLAEATQELTDRFEALKLSIFKSLMGRKFVEETELLKSSFNNPYWAPKDFPQHPYFTEPTEGESFRQLVQSVVEREEWRNKVQAYLDEAFANECEIQYDDFVTVEGIKKVLTINWETDPWQKE